MNLPQQTEPVAPAASDASANADHGTLEQRLAAIHETLREETFAEQDAEPQSAAATDEEPAAVPAAPPPSAAADSAAAAERRARLAALKSKERERVERTERKGESSRIAAELEAARKDANEARALADKRVDIDSLDEGAFFRLAQQKGIRPERLGEWIRDAMANPEKVAEAAAHEAARKAVDPQVKALEAKIAALEARDAERERTLQAHQQQQREHAAASEFFQFTESSAAQAPYSAAFLRAHGPEQFYKLAVNAAQGIEAGAGWQPILDTIEEQLSSLAPIFGAPSKASPAPQTLSRSAAAKANHTTVSNSLAQERASVVEEDDGSSLSFDERVARIKASTRW